MLYNEGYKGTTAIMEEEEAQHQLVWPLWRNLLHLHQAITAGRRDGYPTLIIGQSEAEQMLRVIIEWEKD